MGTQGDVIRKLRRQESPDPLPSSIKYSMIASKTSTPPLTAVATIYKELVDHFEQVMLIASIFVSANYDSAPATMLYSGTETVLQI